MWSKRYRDLGRARTQLACRLHALLCDLVPGGFGGEITAGRAAGQLARITPADPAARARCELAAEFLTDLHRLDIQLRGTGARLAAGVRASGTTLTEIFGVGPVIAAAVISAAGDVSRFADRDRSAAYNGTAPVEVSSGGRKLHRLSLRGNRRLNHAIHMAAVTQIRYQHSPGRGYFDRKVAEGKTGNEALRALKRQLRDAIYARLQADAARQSIPAQAEGPGGQSGNGSVSSAAGSHPGRRLLGQATPGTATKPTTRRPGPTTNASGGIRELARNHLTTKRSSIGTPGWRGRTGSSLPHIRALCSASASCCGGRGRASMKRRSKRNVNVLLQDSLRPELAGPGSAGIGRYGSRNRESECPILDEDKSGVRFTCL